MLCAKCGEEIEGGTRFCRFCGAPATAAIDPDAITEVVPPVAPVLAAIAPPSPPAPQATPNPWEPSPPLESWDPSQSWERSDPPRGRAGMWVFVAGLVFVLCAGAAIAAYFLLRDDSGSASTVSTDTAAGTTAGPGTTVPNDQTTGSTAGQTTTTSAVETAPVDLSAQADINVSSTLAAQGSTSYSKANLIDTDPTTCWAEGVAGYGIGEFIEFTFADPVTIQQLRIVPGYDKTTDGWDRWISNGRVRSFDLSFSDGTVESYSVADSREPQVIALSISHTVTSVRVTITAVYEAAEGPNKAEDTSVSELHFWGAQ